MITHGKTLLSFIKFPPQINIHFKANRDQSGEFLYVAKCNLGEVKLIKGAVSRQPSSFCLILRITCPQLLWNLK